MLMLSNANTCKQWKGFGGKVLKILNRNYGFWQNFYFDCNCDKSITWERLIPSTLRITLQITSSVLRQDIAAWKCFFTVISTLSTYWLETRRGYMNIPCMIENRMTPYLDQTFEITDDFLGFVKVLGEHKMKWPISEAVWPLFSWLKVPKFLWFGPMNYLWMYYTWNQFQSLSSDKQKPNNNTKSTYIIFVSIHVDFWD